MSERSEIKYLFEPRSIAIIGASHESKKIGYQVLENIISGGFKGDVYPLNPKGGEILGKKVYASMVDVPKDVDVAVITIPAKFVYDSVVECKKKNVKYLVIITAGFSEIGNNSEEKKIVDFARANGMRVLGPNIFGVYSSSAHLNATFGPKDIRTGNVAIVTQSGAIGIAMTGKTKVENIGLSAIISVGNKADIDEGDLLEYLITHDETKIILMYMEGVRGGERFVELLRRATAKKPVVVIKSGRSKRGAQAAASHTGSLAGADEVFDDIVRQCGVVRAESIDEALNWCKFLSSTSMPKGENTVIITNGGGVGVLAADACEKYGVNLCDDVAGLKEAFAKVMPEFGSAKNPVDLTGGASAEDYNKALLTGAKDKMIDSVICLGCETASFDADMFARTVETVYKKYENVKPITFAVFGGEKIENCIGVLRKKDIPIYPDVYEAVSPLGALYQHFRNSLRLGEDPVEPEIDLESVSAVIKKVRASGRHFLLANESCKVMEAAGIKMPRSAVGKNLSEAVKIAEEIGYPVVMKVVSKDIIHKSDAGGVLLDLENRSELIDGFETIIHNCKKYKPNAVIEGVEIAEQIKPGIEIIVGARRDVSFGPIVMFGLGGIYVEVMKDVTFRAYPLGPTEIKKMISEIRSYPLLLGVRGEARKDIENVADTIARVGALLYNCPEISDIEVNPLMVYEQGEGGRAVDARILLTKNGVEG